MMLDDDPFTDGRSLRRAIGSRLTFSNVVALVSLAVAITSTAYAASVTGAGIADGTITGRDVKNGSLGGVDVTNNSIRSADVAGVRGADIADGTVGTADVAGLTGADITNGTVGAVDLATGTVPTVLWAQISPAATPKLQHGKGIVTVTGTYDDVYVQFDRNITSCAVASGFMGPIGGGLNPGHLSAQIDPPDLVRIRAYETDGTTDSVPVHEFHLIVAC